MKSYRSLEVLKLCYSEIGTTDSLDHGVDTFWLNTINYYFLGSGAHGNTYRGWLDVTELGTEISIRDVIYMRRDKEDVCTCVVFLNDPKARYKSEDGMPRGEIRAQQLLSNLMNEALQRSDRDTMYGAISCETYISFFYLERQGSLLHKYPTARPESWLELKQDEEVVHKVLLELVEKTGGS